MLAFLFTQKFKENESILQKLPIEKPDVQLAS
jgi:hypothetical protein